MFYMFEALLVEAINSKCFSGDDILDEKLHLDVGDILDMVDYYLTKWSSGSHDIAGISKHNNEWDGVTGEVINLLGVIIDRYPSNIHAWMLLAKIRFQLREINEAEMLLDRCQSIFPHSGLSHLMKAQIQLVASDINEAEQSLERALSEDFNIQCHPLYFLVKGSLCLRKVRNTV